MAPKRASSGPAASPAKSQGGKKKHHNNVGNGLATSNPPEIVETKPTSAMMEKEKKKQNFIVRTVWTVVMMIGFFIFLAAGHIWIMALVTAIQILTFKEVIALANEPAREKKLPYGKIINWYFLATTIYFLYGESVVYYFKQVVLVDYYLLPFATHHRFISYMLYIIGFMIFVSSLEKGHYKFQFAQFAFTHVTLLLVVVQAHFIMNNIFAGLFWFCLPASLVIINDIFAYLCGITFGRTPLIKISPKKTVEGFVGAWISTIVFGMILSHFLIKWKYMICPITDFSANAWSGLSCEPNPVFVKQTFAVPSFLAKLVHRTTYEIAPIHFHVMVMASFASLIAPFGGFFASGLKRTFQIKDFGDTIPGHGGITDRMDCQFLMGFFSYMYYDSFIATHHLRVGSVLETAIQSLTLAEQMQLVSSLHKYLYNQGYITEEALECLEKISS
ncbi:cytidylyltransferase family-domain-containing protein [Lipomyces orientalis]|uniref:Cytidylyltransferase family-domain-containing protein n=1 Tax=Lipomyces orientalis TaxID=1233043 RepID=A0ACC3TNI7_9ASCO